MQQLLRKHATKLRFAIIGGINTILDFSVLFLLVNMSSMPYVIANIASVSVAFVFSFFANRKFTFKSNDGNIIRQAILFGVVTLFGLWVIQSVVIVIITALLAQFGVVDNLSLLISKLVATVVSLVWNFVLYSKIVFKNSSEK